MSGGLFASGDSALDAPADGVDADPPQSASERRGLVIADPTPIVVLIGALAAVLSILSGQEPTGNPFADAVCAALIGAGLVWFSQYASGTALVWSCCLALFFTAMRLPIALLGVVAVLGAFAMTALPNLDRNTRRVGAAVTAAILSQVVLNLPSFRFVGSASMLAVSAMAPMAFTGFQAMPERNRRWLVRGAIIAAVLAAAASVLAVYAALSVRDSVSSGIDQARDGVVALQDGEQEAAAALLQASQTNLANAEGRLSGPLTWPARLVPVMAHQSRALEIAVDEGARLARTAERVVTIADVEQIRGVNGAIDLDLVGRLNLELTNANLQMREARESLREARTPWLIPPLDDQIAEVEIELINTGEDIDLANLGTTVVPRILGAEGRRRYLVVFTQPSEAREFGGLMSAYALLEADNGQITLADSGPVLELLADEAAGQQTAIVNPERFPQHFANSRPDLFPQNLTSTPDLQQLADMARDLVPQWRLDPGFTIDGVIVMDPYAVAGLLELTGPVSIEGRTDPLDSNNVVDFLLRGQYVEFEDDSREERQDSLGELASNTFTRLLEVEVPGPERLGAIFGPIARANRLAVATYDDEENEFFEQVKLSGDFPVVGSGVDMLGVYTTTRIASKLAGFENRSITYVVDVDPGARTARGVASVAVTNNVPADAPGYVKGNDGGNNWLWLSVYSRSRVTGFADFATGLLREAPAYSYTRHSAEVEVPPGTTTTFTFTTERELEGPRYDLILPAQATANITDITVVVRPAAGWRIVGQDLGPDGSWEFRAPLDVTRGITVEFERS